MADIDVTLKIPSARKDYILDGMCRFHNYDQHGNGRTKAQFVKDIILEIMVNDASAGWMEIEAERIALEKDPIKTDLETSNAV